MPDNALVCVLVASLIFAPSKKHVYFHCPRQLMISKMNDTPQTVRNTAWMMQGEGREKDERERERERERRHAVVYCEQPDVPKLI